MLGNLSATSIVVLFSRVVGCSLVLEPKVFACMYVYSVACGGSHSADFLIFWGDPCVLSPAEIYFTKVSMRLRGRSCKTHDTTGTTVLGASYLAPDGRSACLHTHTTEACMPNQDGAGSAPRGGPVGSMQATVAFKEDDDYWHPGYDILRVSGQKNAIFCVALLHC